MKWETVLLLGSDEVVSCPTVASGASFHLRRLPAVPDSADSETAVAVVGRERGRFYEAAR